MSLSKTNKSVIHKLRSNKVYTTLSIVLFGILLVSLVLFIVKKFGKCSKCCLSSESFDNSMIVSAKTYDTAQVKYKDRVYMVKGRDFTVNDDSIRLNGVVKKLRIDDIIIGEEAPGFMRKITKVIRGKKDTLLMTLKVDIDKVLADANFDQTFTFKDFVITGEDSSKFQLSDDGIKMIEKFNVDILNEQIEGNTFSQTVTTGFSNTKLGLSVSLIGTVTITPYVYVKGSIGLISGVNSFSLETGGNVSFELQVPVSIQKQINTSVFRRLWPIGIKELAYQWNIPVCVGVWITIKPTIDGVATTTLSAALTINNYVSLRTVQPFFIKFSYVSEEVNNNNTNLITSIGDWELHRDIDFTSLSTRLSCDIKTSLYFDLNFLLWGITGPYISFRPYYKLTSSVNKLVKSPIYNLEYGPGIDILIGGKFFIFTYDKLIYDNWWYNSSENSLEPETGKSTLLGIKPLDPNRFRIPQQN